MKTMKLWQETLTNLQTSRNFTFKRQPIDIDIIVLYYIVVPSQKQNIFHFCYKIIIFCDQIQNKDTMIRYYEFLFISV